ncbi:hypothetical protein MMC22_010697 [Lobaria immixta]|nr:hypothetical protein [Lobaria immixta]
MIFCEAVWGLPLKDVGPLLSAAGGNQTALRTQTAPGFISEATYRGTFSILWSCVLTLTACIYSALHLNIPLASQQSLLWRKVRWAAFALIAPEAVLFMASDQYFAARNCKKKLQDSWESTKRKLEDREGEVSFAKFDLRYGFYVVMGGLTLDVEKMHGQECRMTLTPQGVIALAERGHFIDVRPETVSDKSKANAIAKTLKPLDIGEPTLLGPSEYAEYEEHIALMLMTKRKELVNVTLYPTQETGERSGYSERSWNDGEEHTVKVFGRPNGSISEQRNDVSEQSLILHNGEFLESGIGPKSDDGYIKMSAKDVRRWELASKELKELGKDEKMSNDKDADKDEEMGEDQEIGNINKAGKVSKEEENGNKIRAPELPLQIQKRMPQIQENYFSALAQIQEKYFGALAQIQEKYFGALATRSRNAQFNSALTYYYSLGILPLIYGGIHLAAWNFDFPSHVESILWKVSSFIIMGLIPVVVLLFLLGVFVGEYLTSWNTFLSVEENIEIAYVMGLAILGFLLYGFARIFLVVESFISLRHVPIGVYAAVPWVQNIPHV